MPTMISTLHSEQHKMAITRLDALIGTPLRSITRAADMVCFMFGDLIEKDALYRDENRRATLKKNISRRICASCTMLFQDSMWQ